MKKTSIALSKLYNQDIKLSFPHSLSRIDLMSKRQLVLIPSHSAIKLSLAVEAHRDSLHSRSTENGRMGDSKILAQPIFKSANAASICYDPAQNLHFRTIFTKYARRLCM